MARKKTAKVENNPDLEKDLDSGAVINTNSSELYTRRQQISLLQEKDNEIKSMKDDIEEL